jgi:hypothetical protein
MENINLKNYYDNVVDHVESDGVVSNEFHKKAKEMKELEAQTDDTETLKKEFNKKVEELMTTEEQEYGKNRDTSFEKSELDKITEDIMNLPPLTGYMVTDYNTLILKEMAMIGKVWTEYRDTNASNKLIDNHISRMNQMYADLIDALNAISVGSRLVHEEESLNETTEKETPSEEGSDTTNAETVENSVKEG